MRRFPVLLSALILVLAAADAYAVSKRPPDIVDAATIVPRLRLDMRYLTDNNFIGRPIAGYVAPKCYLTRDAAEALKEVQEELVAKGYSLKVYDCYRPQRAVDDFARWGRDHADRKMKAEFYPDIAKRRLFREGYIAHRSGHSRGSTVDLTIVPLDAAALAPRTAGKSYVCDGPQEARSPDDSLDMGTSFDCFSERSAPSYADLSAAQKANRKLLKSLMNKHGFRGLRGEWWHFTLRGEPYPGTYFDFPVE
jgi:D-alanyl-D-alanine dipeptidase